MYHLREGSCTARANRFSISSSDVTALTERLLFADGKTTLLRPLDRVFDKLLPRVGLDRIRVGMKQNWG